MSALLGWIPLLLFIGAAVNGAFAVAGLKGKKVPEQIVALVGCGLPLVTLVLSFLLLRGLSSVPEHSIHTTFFRWIHAGGVDIGLTLGADQLTVVMLLVICGVGSLIHIYSVGYMKGDAGFARFFSHLNLFVALMTTLVLGRDLVVLFVGWEGVGLCSYLLIGFWWKDSEKAKAGMKAFVVNRIGDAGFLLGMFALWKVAGTLDIGKLSEFMGSPDGQAAMLAGSGVFGLSVATLIGLLLFIGATGKSAQIPLYVWLPDAMAGPTPVSALIHAATMVTAGVYLVARLNFLYILSPVAQGVIMIVAASTCLVAALLAVVQFDIKKVLAYSTISQIGYMMLGVASGHIGVGIFHVVTHAFFKACLFLGAGSVIHMCHHEQDMRKMGGLGRMMPWTCTVMTVSAAAMAGVPLLSGFFSKDAVLWYTFDSSQPLHFVAWLMAMIAAACTGFYMFRLIFMTFGGRYRGYHFPREAPWVMVGPTQVLALGALLIGFLGVPEFLGGHDRIVRYIEGIIPEWSGHAAEAAQHMNPATHLSLEWALMLLSVLVGIAGICAAWWCYIRKPETPGNIAKQVPRLHEALSANLSVDEGYVRRVVAPLERFAKWLHEGVDIRIIDRCVNGAGVLARRVGSAVSVTQAGNVRGYVALMVAGMLLLLLTILG